MDAAAQDGPDAGHPQRFSVFDLDRTLTRRGTYLPFLIHAALRLGPWRLLLLPAVAVGIAAYKLKALSRTRLKEIMQGVLLGPSIEGDRIGRVAEGYAARLVVAGCHPEGRSLIDAERAEGRVVMLATAAHRFYADPIGRHLGIDHIVATESLWTDGALSNRIDGLNAYGAQKAVLFERRLSQERRDGAPVHVRFFSDDISDRPMFERADEPVAVNPSRRLRALAEREGWLTLDWRSRRRAR